MSVIAVACALAYNLVSQFKVKLHLLYM